MASTLGLLAATLMLFSSARALSSEQCDVTVYGAPNKAACNTLLTNISKLGGLNTSYLFMPPSAATPDGYSNSTRRNFPQYWNTTGCNAALVPAEIFDDEKNQSYVTYDTSTYPDLAAAGSTVVQQCLSNKSVSETAAGGFELAGDLLNLVLHIYATGSQIDKTVKQQNDTSYATTLEDDNFWDAIMDDTEYATNGSIDGSTDGSFNGSTDGSFNGSFDGSFDGANFTAAEVVQLPGNFKYFGCQHDRSNDRTLYSRSSSDDNLTVEACAQFCDTYLYMGVESGSECYCGGDFYGKGVKTATLVTDATNNCTTPCVGNASEICGGSSWLTSYQNKNPATAGQTA